MILTAKKVKLLIRCSFFNKIKQQMFYGYEQIHNAPEQSIEIKLRILY